VLAHHEHFGREAIHLHLDRDILDEKDYRATLELFQSDIAPVLRRELPSRLFPPLPAPA
jgi:hypothetical protein